METTNGNAVFKYLNTSEQWKEGYRVYHKLLNKPLGWFFFSGQKEKIIIRRLNRKECCNVYSEINTGQGTCARHLIQQSSKTLEMGKCEDIRFFRCFKNRICCFVPLEHGKVKGFIIFCNLPVKEKKLREKVGCFVPFLNSELDSHRRICDLQNVYETVHPRAIALSSLHSVNRVISSTLKLDDLIPKIGRLCIQILKTESCSILLVDDNRKWLIPRFVSDPSRADLKNKRFAVGKGVYGHVAESGDYHLGKHFISLPLIDDDVIGVISIKNKINKKPFSRSDVEVLKALSEQAVVAIRNSQLLEEHERITLGSIQSINNILDINLPRERRNYSHSFASLVFELAKAMELNDELILNIQRATQLLDTGHLGIPESIREKRGALTKREFDIIKTHPYRGVEIIQSIDSLKPIIPIILYHHERYDGKGYPEGLQGTEIPLGARILSLAVAFFAMISSRPYREARSVSAAIEEIREMSGTQFDPLVVKTFLDLIKQERIINMIQEAANGTKNSN
jgi:hypothetical protein